MTPLPSDTNSHPIQATEAMTLWLDQQSPLLVARIRRALFCSPSDASLALREVVRYLYLAANTTTPLTPSPRLDLAWHEFLLFTRLYATFCDRFFHRFLHHEPGGDRQVNAKQFQLAIEQYTATFGELPHAIWFGGASQCGSCEVGD